MWRMKHYSFVEQPFFTGAKPCLSKKRRSYRTTRDKAVWKRFHYQGTNNQRDSEDTEVDMLGLYCYKGYPDRRLLSLLSKPEYIT